MKTPDPVTNFKYQFELQNFTLSMALSEKEEIQMEFFNRQGEISYSLFIDQKFINQNTNLLVVFRCPMILFEDLLANINGISASLEGIITFTFTLINSRQMSFKFNAKKVAIYQQEKVLQFVNGLIKDHCQRIEFLEKQNEKLKSRLNEMVQLDKFHECNQMIVIQLQKLKNEMAYIKLQAAISNNRQQEFNNELKAQNNLICEKKQQQINQLNNLRQQLQELYIKIAQLREQRQADINLQKQKITIYDDLYEKKQIQIMDLKKDILNAYTIIDLANTAKQADSALVQRQINNVYNMIQIFNEEKDNFIVNNIKQLSLSLYSVLAENSKRFIVQCNRRTIKLNYKNNCNYYAFIRPFAIENDKITRLQVRQIRTANRYVMYGISTDKTVGMQNPFYNAEFKSYQAYSGRVWQNGNSRISGAAINDGSILTIVVDLINGRVSWEANGNQLGETQISEVMRMKKLYFTINMYNQNDQVEILDY